MYCKGNVDLLNDRKIVAIVGSRNCSEYGRKYANIFATELSKRGICVVSGMAVGIDASAHCGAMCEKGKTIAVLGGGFKYIYPSQNLWLYNNIIDAGGCVITEYEENEETKMSNFPKRNRLISGLADAVLVIEAEHRSGSKITAKYAKLQKKKVYCIPINLDQKNSSGIKELLIDGAKIVTTPRQLIEDLYGKRFYKSTRESSEESEEWENEDASEIDEYIEPISMDRIKKNSKNITSENTENQRNRENKIKENKTRKGSKKRTYSEITNGHMKEKRILLGNDENLLQNFERIKNVLKEEMTSEEIAKSINEDIAEVNSMLTIMEIEGVIEQMPGNYYVRADKKIG